MDTKFSVAIHLLILISEAPAPMNSEQMAGSVGTNASYVRKVLALLKQAEIVDSRRGCPGYKLAVSPERLKLLKIYEAVMDDGKIHLLDVHQNPNDQCVVGRHIRPVLTGMFREFEEAFAQTLDKMTLSDCIMMIRKEMNEKP